MMIETTKSKTDMYRTFTSNEPITVDDIMQFGLNDRVVIVDPYGEFIIDNLRIGGEVSLDPITRKDAECWWRIKYIIHSTDCEDLIRPSDNGIRTEEQLSKLLNLRFIDYWWYRGYCAGINEVKDEHR